MNILSKFNQTFGFTQTESRVIFFLVLTFVAGIGIKVYRLNCAPENKFDYTVSDSLFAASSANAEKDSSISNQDSTDELSKSDVSKTLFSSLIDINKATKEELIKLPGIGESIAERIINYRKENGAFTSIESLKKVKGIGEKKFEKISSLVTVGK